MRDQDQIERVAAATQPLPVETDVSAPEVPAAIHERVLSTRQLAWRRFKRHKLAIGSLSILILLGLLTLFIPLISQYNFSQLNLFRRLLGPGSRLSPRKRISSPKGWPTTQSAIFST